MPEKVRKSKSTKPIKWYESLNQDAIEEALEDATADSMDDGEQLAGLFYSIAENMAFPWLGSLLGETVSVVDVEMPDSDRLGIDLVVEKNGKQSRIECRSVELLPPYPDGHLYWAAYLCWKERM